jgi:hypothetical protein
VAVVTAAEGSTVISVIPATVAALEYSEAAGGAVSSAAGRGYSGFYSGCSSSFGDGCYGKGLEDPLVAAPKPTAVANFCRGCCGSCSSCNGSGC